jgi:glycosyltransferase involved in cell wall biosynthesis
MSPITFNIQPEISVILCTYNRAKSLNDCIKSVIHQTFENWELVIVDDGSEDDSFDVIQPYIQKFNNPMDNQVIKKNNKNEKKDGFNVTFNHLNVI